MTHRSVRKSPVQIAFKLFACLSSFAPSFHVVAGELRRDAVVAILPELSDLARKTVSDGIVPGLAVAIVFRDEVVYLEGFGTKRVGQSETVGPDTVFPLASLSKPLAATVVAPW